MDNTISDFEVQNILIGAYFGKNLEEIGNEEVLIWIEKFSEKFRRIWESGDCEICEIMKKLYKPN